MLASLPFHFSFRNASGDIRGNDPISGLGDGLADNDDYQVFPFSKSSYHFETDAHLQNADFAEPDLDHVTYRQSDPRARGEVPDAFQRCGSPAHLRVQPHRRDTDMKMFSSAYESNRAGVILDKLG
jgi:hypothetical protein